MKTLWFKAEFVAPILSGDKRDTIRKPSNRLPSVGDEVAFSVGPRTPFARAVVVAVESIDPSRDVSSSRAAQVAGCYDRLDGHMVRIDFRLIDKLE